MPLLAVLGVGALVGLAGYVGYRAVKHFFFHQPWDITWKGVGVSLAAGAVALPAVLFGSGILATAAGVELTPLAVGGATSIVGAITGSTNDDHDKKAPEQQQPPRVERPPVEQPQVNPNFDPFSDPAAVTTQSDTTATDTAPVTTQVSSDPVSLPTEVAPVESSLPTLETPGEPDRPAQPAQAQQTYKVQSGDTLSQIAKDQGISLKDLEKANPQLADRKLPKGFQSPWDFIRTGEQIFLPSKTPGLNAALGQIGAPVPGNDK